MAVKYKIGDRIRVVQMGNAGDFHLNGNTGTVIGIGSFGTFIDVHMDDVDLNQHNDDEYTEKYIIVFESEIEKI